MNYLVVVAHPDDEVLGAGAVIYRLAKEGHSVSVCILSGEVSARNQRPELEILKENIEKANITLGTSKLIRGKFPNIEFNNIPHLTLVKFIEEAIVETKAEVLFTHHPSDLNNDHLHTSLACQVASRLFQRRPDVTPVKELLFMEILSATEWGLNQGMNYFNPNTFFEIGKIGLDKKIEALSHYQGVLRNYPHPRSKEVLKSLASFRGCQGGVNYAEAFQSVFRRVL